MTVRKSAPTIMAKMKILLCLFLALGACHSSDRADDGDIHGPYESASTNAGTSEVYADIVLTPLTEQSLAGAAATSGVVQILLLLALLISAFLTTRFIVRFAGRRWFLALPGLPYLVIGLLVGPAVFEVISARDLSSLQPAVTVGIGSIGLLAGLRLNFRKMRDRLEMEHIRSAFWIACSTAVIVGIPALLLLGWYVGARWPLGLSFPEGSLVPNGLALAESADLERMWIIIPPALLIVSTAMVSGTTPIQYTIERYRAKGWMSTFAVYVAEFSEVIGIMVFSLVFAIANDGESFADIELGKLHWLVIQIAIGVLSGLLFTLFIGRSDDNEKLLVALLGIIVFTSGVAYYLRLSPLLVTFFVGLVLANLSGFAERLRVRLEAVEKPFFIVICFFAGMQLVPSFTWWALLLIPGYIFLRWSSKWVGGEIAFRYARRESHVIRGVGSAMISQGGLAVAMLLSYMQVTSSAPTLGSAMFETNMASGYLQNVQKGSGASEVVPIDLVGNIVDPAVGVTSIVATVILAGIILNDTFSFISTRNLLINAGEIDPDVDVIPEDIYAHPELQVDTYHLGDHGHEDNSGVEQPL